MRAYDILLVDDDPLILRTVGPALAQKRYGVTLAAGGTEATRTLRRKHVDLVLTDLVMDAVDGIGVITAARTVNPEVMAIVLTGFGDLDSAIAALRLGADDYLLKPCEMDEIFFRVANCFEKLEMRRKIKAYERILPVCCVCKNIRDDTGREPGTGEWMPVEKYLWMRKGIASTSTYCSVCREKVMMDIESGKPAASAAHP